MTESTESLLSRSNIGLSDAEIRLLTTPCPTEQAIHRKPYTDEFATPPIDWHLFDLVKAALPAMIARFCDRGSAIVAAIDCAEKTLAKLREKQARQ